MNIKEQLQESLDDYTLKSDKEIIDQICHFGCGETEFHTADIERVIKEKQHLEKKLNDLINWMKSDLSEEYGHKMDKRPTPYSEEKKKFLNKAIKTLEL